MEATEETDMPNQDWLEYLTAAERETYHELYEQLAWLLRSDSVAKLVSFRDLVATAVARQKDGELKRQYKDAMPNTMTRPVVARTVRTARAKGD